MICSVMWVRLHESLQMSKHHCDISSMVPQYYIAFDVRILVNFVPFCMHSWCVLLARSPLQLLNFQDVLNLT